MVDAENPAVETTPLVAGDSYNPDDEPPPLKDMKEQSLKEKMVVAASAVGSKCWVPAITAAAVTASLA